MTKPSSTGYAITNDGRYVKNHLISGQISVWWWLDNMATPWITRHRQPEPSWLHICVFLYLCIFNSWFLIFSFVYFSIWLLWWLDKNHGNTVDNMTALGWAKLIACLCIFLFVYFNFFSSSIWAWWWLDRKYGNTVDNMAASGGAKSILLLPVPTLIFWPTHLLLFNIYLLSFNLYLWTEWIKSPKRFPNMQGVTVISLPA